MNTFRRVKELWPNTNLASMHTWTGVELNAPFTIL